MCDSDKYLDGIKIDSEDGPEPSAVEQKLLETKLSFTPSIYTASSALNTSYTDPKLNSANGFYAAEGSTEFYATLVFEEGPMSLRKVHIQKLAADINLVVENFKIHYLALDNNWYWYDSGNLISTGMTASVPVNEILEIDISATNMVAQQVKIYFDGSMAGRFDISVFPF